MVKIRVLPPTQEDIRYCIEYARDEFGRKCVLRWKKELEAIYARLIMFPLSYSPGLFWKIFIEIIVAHCLWTTSSSFIATTKSVTKSSLLTFGTPNVLNKHYWDNSKGNYKNLASKGLQPFARYILIFYHFIKWQNGCMTLLIKHPFCKLTMSVHYD